MEAFFMDGKRRIVIAICQFPQFHLGENDGGKGDTIMPEKSEGDTIQKLFRGRIQNMWGEGPGGGQIIQALGITSRNPRHNGAKVLAYNGRRYNWITERSYPG